MFSQSQNCSQLRSLLTVLAANSKLPLAHFYGYFTAIFLLFMCYHSTSTVQIQIKSERIERQRRRRPLINGSNYGAANDSRSLSLFSALKGYPEQLEEGAISRSVHRQHNKTHQNILQNPGSNSFQQHSCNDVAQF